MAQTFISSSVVESSHKITTLSDSKQYASSSGSTLSVHEESSPQQPKDVQEKQSTPDPQDALTWSGGDDPDNPHNWNLVRKCVLTFFLALVTFASAFSSSLFAAGVAPTAKQFHVSTEVTTLETSLFVAGFAAGPLAFGPLSEQIGRKIPLFTGCFLLTIFHIPVAVAPNLATLLVFRFLAGVGGSAPLAVIGGILADFWDPVSRGVAICGFASATFAGPILAPICGSFMIVSGLSWRWLGYLIIILAGTIFCIGIFLVPETHAPTLLRRRASKRTAEDADVQEKVTTKPKLDIKTIVVIYFMRPFVMMVQEPILTLITLYMSFLYGLVYLNFSAWPISFVQERGWSPGMASLPFLSITVGVFIGCGLTIYLTKTRFARKMRENNGVVVPEERLVPMMIGAPLIPISLFWWAWTSNPNITWVPQVLAGIPFGCGILMIFLQGLNYLIDVYRNYANSAISGNAIVRSLIGAGFPLFAKPIYAHLGVAWATSLLGFLGVAMVPIPFVFYIYGARIRQWSKFSPTTATTGIAGQKK